MPRLQLSDIPPAVNICHPLQNPPARSVSVAELLTVTINVVWKQMY